MIDGRSVAAILLAAGRGERTGAGVPKQFVDLAGRPLFMHSLETIAASSAVDALILVLPEERPEFVDREVEGLAVSSVAVGAETRQGSLAAGLACIPEETAIVLVHDAARPLVTKALVDRVAGALDGSCHGVVCAIPLEDAIKEVSMGGEVLAARRRTGLWRAQTPQAFLRASLEDALARADADGVECEDCSELLTRAGYRVKVVEGDPWNLKVTLPKDVSLAERIIAARAEGRR